MSQSGGDLDDRRQPSPWIRWLAWLTPGCRYLLSAIFLMAALTKIADLPEFTDRVVLHSGLPHNAAVAWAAFLPWLELTCGLCLALGVMDREAALILAVLLLTFIGHSLIRPARPDCGCFLFPGLTPTNSSLAWLLARNLMLLGCAAWICRTPITTRVN